MTEQCPRCGAEECVEFAPRHRFTVPIDIFGYHATHWAVCLSLREPFMLGHKRRWAWVEFFRWQIAQVFERYVRVAETAVILPAMFDVYTETKNTATAGTYVARVAGARP